MNPSAPITVAIPSYRRGVVLLDTLMSLLAMEDRPAEILVLDQTPQHEKEAAEQLENLNRAGEIRLIRLPTPSIPGAMNRGLAEAREEVVLFIDDDVRPEPGLIRGHLSAHEKNCNGLVAGRVIQPWQEGMDHSRDTEFHFATLKRAWVREFIGCNFSVNRRRACSIGGFDENFIGAAYQYEAEFSARFTERFGQILFEPEACLHHLRLAAGGTRALGDHLRTVKPTHSVGAYYYLLRTRPTGWWWRIPLRPFRSIRTRHHLHHPWWIPLTLAAEMRGLAVAASLFLEGPRLMASEGEDGGP